MGESLSSGKRYHVVSAYFTFVSLGEGGAKVRTPVRGVFRACRAGTSPPPHRAQVKLPPLDVSGGSDEDKRRHREAQERRRIRLERKALVDGHVKSLVASSAEEAAARGLNAREEGQPQLSPAARVQRSCQQSRTEKTTLILPTHANHMVRPRVCYGSAIRRRDGTADAAQGNMFGGNSLAWVYETAYIAANRLVHQPLVLEHIDDIYFKVSAECIHHTAPRLTQCVAW
jgi:acyl-CoA hydrolase